MPGLPKVQGVRHALDWVIGMGRNLQPGLRRVLGNMDAACHAGIDRDTVPARAHKPWSNDVEAARREPEFGVR